MVERGPAARPRRYIKPLIVGLFVLLQSVHFLPPLVMDERRVPLPSAIMASISILVLATLLALDRWTQIRERIGFGLGLVVELILVTGVGAAAGGVWAMVAEGPLAAEVVLPLAPLEGGRVLERAALLHACILVGALSALFQFGLWAVAFVLPGVVEAERVRRLENQNLRLEAAELRTKAELARLRGQLEPHFLLNTLNLVAGLVGTDAARARAVLAALGDLLQDALADHDELRSLDEELAWLRRYVEILEVRHGPQLRVTWAVDGAATAARVPRLLLQPLVENAILHGALRRRAGGAVDVTVTREDDRVVCAISDNGPGLGQRRDGAIGVDNVRSRLLLHFPTGTFELGSGPDGGTRARVSFPFTGGDALTAGRGGS